MTVVTRENTYFFYISCLIFQRMPSLVVAIRRSRGNFRVKHVPMRILVINVLLALGLFAVIAGTIFMVAYRGYDDQLSFTCFVLHSVNAVLLLFREVLR